MRLKRSKGKKTIEDKLRKSPINYFSDLFIVSMVLLWIFDNVYQSIVASIVTFSSIVISFQTGIVSIDTSMWSSIGANVAIPLSCGGGIWMIKNGVQHAIANHRGKRANQDFPKVDGAYNEELQKEDPMMFDEDNSNATSESSELNGKG